MSVAAFELPGKPDPVAAHAGPTILVSAPYYLEGVAMLLQKLIHVPAQTARSADARVGPRRPAGKFHPAVSPQFVLTVGMFHHLIVWRAEVRYTVLEHPEPADRRCLVSAQALTDLTSTGCKSVVADHWIQSRSSHESGLGDR